MRSSQTDLFTTITTEGSLLPSDFLQRLSQNDRSVEGLKSVDYHLDPSEKLNEAISRSWTLMLSAWANFHSAVEKLPDSDIGTTVTRERWLQPLFKELGYGRLITAKAVEIEGKQYPISHFWQNTPIHLISFRAELDKRSERIVGASRSSPHSMMQEFLNRSHGHLWAVVSNGYRLRILRDNVSLIRQAYVEFDLQAMMEGEVFADFVLLYLLCHQSRVEAERPELCWLEKWTQSARQQGTRALDQLRVGVEDAINALGSGFISYPANNALREKLKSGTLSTQDYYRQLLRTVYRFLFLFVAEDRDVLLVPTADATKRSLYAKFYSTARLRQLAAHHTGTKHPDVWHSVQLLFSKLSSSQGCPELGLPALGSFLWSEQGTPELDPCVIANRDVLHAIRLLAFTEQARTLRPVDYKNLGMKELGSVYTSLLEQHPHVNVDAGTFTLEVSAGNERKTTGSYYTDDSLVQCLLDSALDPVLDEACKKPDPEQAILSLKVCDPAMGSGHTLIAAAHRMAKRLAAIRTGEDEPAPEAIRTALRDVIGHCIYGVDINPMAVELCKFALWLEALEPGKPLSFLDHHIKCGNSLLGTTPALLRNGIPDEAFETIEGDDKTYAREFKRVNRNERTSHRGQELLFDFGSEPWMRLGDLPTTFAHLFAEPDDTLEQVQHKEREYANLVRSTPYEFGKLWADAWCSAFVWKKTKAFSFPITEEVFRKIEKSPHNVAGWTKAEVQRLAKQYEFFHWHLEFPDVFHVPSAEQKPENEQTGWSGGFDVELGNPPWERVKLQEKEWFAQRRPDIANARNAAERKRMIAALKKEDPSLYNAFLDDSRQAEGESQLLRSTGRYPLCGRGDINTYAVFAELFKSVINSSGRVGVIVPSGIATDDTTKFFFRDIIDAQMLVCLYDFENSKAIFPGVHRSFKFCLLTLSGQSRPVNKGAEFIFFAQTVEDLLEDDRRFTLTAEDIALLNPNTHTCPIFRSSRDAVLTKRIYRAVPVLRSLDGNVGFRKVSYSQGLFHSSSDANLYTHNVRSSLIDKGATENGYSLQLGNSSYVPMYEGRMVWQFDHRYGSYEVVESRESTHLPSNSLQQYQTPDYEVLPFYWVDSRLVENRLRELDPRTGDVLWEWKRDWFLAFRDVTNSTNERTAVFAIIPRVGVSDQLGLLYLDGSEDPSNALLLLANANSFVLDYVARQKIGSSHLKKYLLYQLPFLQNEKYSEELRKLVKTRSLELVFTSWAVGPIANDSGYAGPPFKWDEERRFLLRCELDAAYFHLYGIERDDVDYIMETFPIVKRRDEAKHNEYRTKRVILEIYDEMSRVSFENVAAVAAGRQTIVRYRTRLDPPPGPPCDTQGNFIPIAQWDPANWPSHIHKPREAVLAVPEEVSVVDIAAMAYPATEADKAVCAAALAVVEQSGGISSMEHLDALLLATHPDWCKAFLDNRGRAAFDRASKSAPDALFVSQNESIRWKECRDYLERLGALTVAHGAKDQDIGIGSALASAKTNLPTGVHAMVKCALAALDHIRDLRKDLTSVPQVQRSILDIFAEQHRQQRLAA